MRERLPPSVAATKKRRCCAEAVELIRAGSLIVDDIEDGSPSRRSRPSLYLRFGMPVALNAGNWLYFVGAGTHPGAGVPGVVNSVKATANVILADFTAALVAEARRTPSSPRHDAMTPGVRAALAECREIVRKGSKSFPLAPRLFDPETRDGTSCSTRR